MSNPGWVGQTLSGRYKIEELLGQGGMSAVYKASDPNLRRVVAVKLIHAHLSSNPDFVRRFEDEARAVAQLRHPNIIQVYDFNHDGDTFYMVLEFVPGETLQAHLKRLNLADRRLPLKDALKYAIHVCDAMDYAHQRGMIHRDIKPANIILNVMGDAILMDFGIAKIMGGEQHTATGAVVGTALYMSPEQIQGFTIDGRSDIYSLGVTLYEMVSGRPPFEADSAMTLMMMHLNDPVPNLRGLYPDVPNGIIAIIEKALAKDREERYPSAAAMGADLRRVLADLQHISAPGATAVETPPESGPAEPAAEQAPQAKPEAPASVVAPVAAASALAPEAAAEKSGTYIEQPAPASAQSGTYVEPPLAGGPPTGGPPTGGGPSVPPAPAPGGGGSQMGRRRLNPLLLGGGAAALLIVACLVVGGIYFLPRLLSGDGGGLAQAASPTVALVATDTPEPSPTPSPTVPSPTPTNTPPPTLTPTITLTPTPTVPPGIPYVRINNITVDGRQYYIVEYETFEYTEELPGMHVHFFFNTVSPEQAGSPGSGPWYLYGGPRPFDKYRVADRPAGAEMMCALVANPNHSIQLDSGNCFPLPDTP